MYIKRIMSSSSKWNGGRIFRSSYKKNIDRETKLTDRISFRYGRRTLCCRQRSETESEWSPYVAVQVRTVQVRALREDAAANDFIDRSMHALGMRQHERKMEHVLCVVDKGARAMTDFLKQLELSLTFSWQSAATCTRDWHVQVPVDRKE